MTGKPRASGRKRANPNPERAAYMRKYRAEIQPKASKRHAAATQRARSRARIRTAERHPDTYAEELARACEAERVPVPDRTHAGRRKATGRRRRAA